MFHESGCYGEVELGVLPGEIQSRLESLSGEWLEFDPPSRSIVVRHIEPTTDPFVPTIAKELVEMLAQLPPELQMEVPGGDLYVHTEKSGKLVRFRVGKGGAMHINWAHPNYDHAMKRPYTGGREIALAPELHRLNGTVTFVADNPEGAAGGLCQVADNFEGLYPEGDCMVTHDQNAGTVRLELKDVNVDATRLVKQLQRVANPRSLEGQFDLTSFAAEQPEHQIRFVFEGGQTWVQHPLLWSPSHADEE